jgi:hypothetical protein
MAVVDATREHEPRERRPIGWDGRTVRAMLEESERLFAETGRYGGVAAARAPTWRSTRSWRSREATLPPPGEGGR